MKKTLTIFICSSLLLASCGSDDDGGSSPNPTLTEPQAPTLKGVLNVQDGKK